MIWIDLESKLPTDVDIPGWKPWSQAEWNAWLSESKRLVGELDKLNGTGNVTARNEMIDANSAHWGKLKDWLLALSSGKCWFSDVRELYSHYDVEHFRPKKEAKALDGTVRDGYWWLGFDYMNFRACGNVGNRKKGGWFPLQTGSLCSSFAHQCEESESVYLLDPIDSSDVELLAFDEEGKAIPVPGCNQWDKQRVDETVKRLKLNEHSALTEERRKVWNKVDGLIKKYKTAQSRVENGPNPAAKQRLKDILQKVRELTHDSAELSAVAKWCVHFRNDGRLSRLIA